MLLDLARSAKDHVLSAEPLTTATLVVILLIRTFDGFQGRQPVRQAMCILAWRAIKNRDRNLSCLLKVGGSLGFILRANARSYTQIDVALAAQHASRLNHDGTSVDPFASPRFVTLLRLVRLSLEPRCESLRVRYLVPDRWSENKLMLQSIERYLAQFDGLQRVSYEVGRYSGKPEFAAGVSALTGAVVLADFASSRAGCTENVTVWHTGFWQGRAPDTRSRPTLRSPFSELVADKNVDVGRLDVYNARVPTLLGVEVRQRFGGDQTTLVLVTGEADYDSTEPPMSASNSDAPVTQCKKLAPGDDLRHLPSVAFVRSSDPGAKRRLGAYLRAYGGDSGRDSSGGESHVGSAGVLLNAKICLISFQNPLDPHLVLMQRSHRTANARGSIGPTAGGVVELGVSHDARDSTEFGSLDVLAGLRREVQEETGLEESDYAASVHCVFQSNNRVRPAGGGAVQRRASDPLDVSTSQFRTGERVATVMAIGTTALGAQDFAAKRQQASAGKGLYESDGVIFVPLGRRASEAASNFDFGEVDTQTGEWFEGDPEISSTAQRERTTRIEQTSSEHHVRLRDAIEQPTLIAFLYASAFVHGPMSTLEAFSSTASSGGRVPWWARPWEGVPPGARSRVCWDPGTLLEDPGEFQNWFASLGLAEPHERTYWTDAQVLHKTSDTSETSPR